MTSEIDTLRSSLPFWDDITALTAVLLLIGAVGPLVIEFTNFVVLSSWKSRIRVISAVLLIAGTGGQIGAQIRISAISSRIVAILDEKGKALEVDVESLKNTNLLLEEKNLATEAKNLELEKRLERYEGRQIQTESRQEKTEKRVEAVVVKTGARTLDEEDLWLHTRKIRRGPSKIMLVRVNEPEPNQYAEKIGKVLKKANIDPTPEPFKELTLVSGVCLCGGNAAKRLSKAMALGGVPNRHLSAKDKDWSDACTTSVPGVFGPTVVTRTGTTIFVGHNPQVVR